MMEESKIGEQMFQAINYVMEHSGDAGRNHCGRNHHQCSQLHEEKARDPEMHQAKKEANGGSA